MSIAPETDTDFQDDIRVQVGTDLFYAFSVEPFDSTGTTASFVTSFGTFAVPLTMVTAGDVVITTFSVSIPAASLPTLAGVYPWRILVVWPFTPTITLQYGHGAIDLKTGW